MWQAENHWARSMFTAAGRAGRQEVKQQTLGCTAHKLRSFLFTDRRPTPMENIARMRRGVCWAILQHTVYIHCTLLLCVLAVNRNDRITMLGYIFSFTNRIVSHSDSANRTHPARCRSYWSGLSRCGPASRHRTSPLENGWVWTDWRAAPPGSTELLWPCLNEDVPPWTSGANQNQASGRAPHKLCAERWRTSIR